MLLAILDQTLDMFHHELFYIQLLLGIAAAIIILAVQIVVLLIILSKLRILC